jgi:excinuclease ABC subunit A
MDLVVPDQTKSIQQGAIEPWSKPHYRSQLAGLKREARKHRIRLDVPWAELSEAEKRYIMDGDSGADSEYEGIRGFFRWLERKKYKVHVRVFLSRYRGYLTCPDCGGARLRREARDVRVAGRTIDRVSSLTVRTAQDFFGQLGHGERVGEKVFKEIPGGCGPARRGPRLPDARPLSSTLSGGEAQRINLARRHHACRNASCWRAAQSARTRAQPASGSTSCASSATGYCARRRRRRR